MSDTADTRPLWQIWRKAEDAALEGVEAADLEGVEALCDAARIEVVRDWIFPDGLPPQPWSVAEYQIWRRLTAEIERCREKALPANEKGEAEASPRSPHPTE